MLKKAVVIVVLGSFAAAPSFAASFIQKLTKHHQKSATHKPAKMKTKASPETFTDFSGHWVGSCSSIDETEELDFTIKNTPYTITFDGEQVVLGELKTESSTSVQRTAP